MFLNYGFKLCFKHSLCTPWPRVLSGQSDVFWEPGIAQTPYKTLNFLDFLVKFISCGSPELLKPRMKHCISLIIWINGVFWEPGIAQTPYKTVRFLDIFSKMTSPAPIWGTPIGIP